MFDFIELFSSLSLISNVKQEPVKDRVIQIISILVFLGCVVYLVLEDINWQIIIEDGRIIETAIIALAAAIIISAVLYKCRILRDIMIPTFGFYILSVLMTTFTAGLLLKPVLVPLKWFG